MANHEIVPLSAFTKGTAERKKFATSSSLPGFASSGTYSANFVITFSCFDSVLSEALPEGSRTVTGDLGRAAVDQPDHRHRRLLRVHGNRPSDCNATQRGYDLSSFDAHCHVTLPWGHIHAMGNRRHPR
jgi:hypothetical protein